MIRYKVINPQNEDEKTKARTQWVDDMFHVIEEKDLESAVRACEIEHNVTISDEVFDGDVTIVHLFRRIGDHQGVFIQIIEEPSGLHLHSESAKFNYSFCD